MSYFSIDYLVVYAFLAITLVIGIWSGRGIKDIREYALANKSFGTGALVLTSLATAIAGASVINGTSITFSSGIIVIVAAFGAGLSYLINGIFITPKFARFDDCLTMGDLMKGFYGPSSGIIAGMLGILNALLLLGMELNVLGIICESLLGIPAKWGVIGGGILLAVYTAHGGIKAVTITDIFQFIVLAIFIPLIAYKALAKVGSFKELLQQTPSDKLAIFTHKEFSFYVTFCLMLIIPAGLIDPAIIQRLLMAKTGKQIRNQYFIMAAFDPAFCTVLMIMGLAAAVLYPNIVPEQITSHLIHNLLPVGVQGLAIAGLLAVCMSTIDSYLHAAGLILVHDVIRPIYKPKSKLLDEVKWSRWATGFISLLSIYIGLKADNLLGLVIAALGSTGPLLMFPLLSGVMGLKADKQEFYIALIITLIAFIVAKLTLPDMYSHFIIMISVTVNGISFFGLHFIRHKGFAIMHKSKGEESLWKPHRKAFFNRLKAVLPTPSNIVAYSQAKVTQYGAPSMLFAIFCLINYIVPFFMWMQVPPQYEDMMIYLRGIGAILCVLLIVQEKWPQALLSYFPTFWHITVLYCLPFTNTVMFLLTEFNTEWLMSILGIIILLLVILDWATAITISLFGVGLGLLFYKLVVGPLVVPISFDAKYLMIYQGLFGILIGLIFARRKQLAYNRIATQRDQLKDMQQEINHRLLEALNYRDSLIKELDSQEIALLDDVTATYIKQAIYRVTDYLKLEVTKIRLEDFLAKVAAIPRLQELTPQPELYIQKHTRVEEIQADEPKLYELFLNSISYIQEHNINGKPIKVVIEGTLLGHTIAHMQDYTRKLAALRIAITTEDTLPVKQELYLMDPSKSSTWITTDKKELPLIENARIIDAHYGYLDVTSPHTHIYVIPIKLREIRSKVMELLREPAAVVEDEIQHPLAIELEKKLLDKLKNTQVEIGLIHKALTTIKKYHGGVKRKSGEPFFTHPIAVALILLEETQDQDAVIAALLHDTIEDTSLSLAHIKAMFGKTVAFIVGKVTNLEDNLRRINLDDHENLHRLINYGDERAALVKLSDRLHNMRTIQHHPSLIKQKNIAHETFSFFVPMAKHLGKDNMARELERLSLEVLNKQAHN